MTDLYRDGLARRLANAERRLARAREYVASLESATGVRAAQAEHHAERWRTETIPRIEAQVARAQRDLDTYKQRTSW